MATVAKQIGNYSTVHATIQTIYGKAEEYESRQKTFEDESQKIIQTAVDQMQQVAQGNAPDYPALFRDLISTFAKERQKIAKEAKTSEPQEFGKERISDPLERTYTPLMDLYAKANEFAIQQLAAQLKPMKRTLMEFQELTKKVEEFVHGRKFSFQIEILTSKELSAFNPKSILDEAKPVNELILKEKPNSTYFERLQKLKEMRPDLYKRDKMHFHLQKICEWFPSPQTDPIQKKVISGNSANFKSDWILMTKRIEINGKMYATTQWLTWVYRTHQRDPVERMLDPEYRPVIEVLHQDIFLTNDTLKECEKIFSDIMKWDSKTATIAQLKNQVALLRYIFAEAMPYARGSAAIGEWLEGAIYRMHGFTCTYHPDYPRESVDLVALQNLTYSSYLHRYQQLVSLSDNK